VFISYRCLIAVALTAAATTGLSAEAVATHRIVGVAGCTAASCHGGKSLIGGEAAAWLTRDVAHRRAYDVLFNETSVRMAQQLGLNAAHTDTRCLACHSTTASLHGVQHGERFAVEYGVGCESCHGAAGTWISRHTQRSWRSLSPDSKSALGFRDLRSLTVRAESCVACHVGSPRATVDHDLIAAGHPRLTFEMSAYHELLPKHWDAAAERQRDPVQELRLWMIGHGVSAKAMSDIALARAESAMASGAKQVTPDLAEFDCHACHHDLVEPTRGRPTLSNPLGSPRWGSWTLAPARIAVRQSQATFGQAGTTTDTSLTKLLNLVNQSRLGTTPAEALRPAAQQSSHDLAAWSRSLEFMSADPGQSTQLLHRLLAIESDAEWLPTWDGQTQRYLAITAAAQSARRATGREPFSRAGREETLAKLLRQFSYPPHYSTPLNFRLSDVEPLLRDLQNSVEQ